MSSLTSRLGLYKPADDGSENVNVVSDLNNNWDRLDSILGAVPVTNATRPASAYSGMIIRETDTGKIYIHNGSTPVSGGWLQIPVAVTTFDSEWSVNNSMSATGVIVSNRSSAASAAYEAKLIADTVARWSATAGGVLEWGAGGSSAKDVNLYRSSANILRTDDSLDVAGNITTAGSGTFGAAVTLSGGVVGNLTVSGDLSVGGIGKVLWAHKTASQNLAQSSTTRQNITTGASGTSALSLNYDVGTWELEGMFIAMGNATADIQFDWTFTTGSSSRFSVGYAGIDTTTAANPVAGDGYWLARQGYTSSPIDIAQFGVNTGAPITIQFRGILVANVAGTLTPRAAQLSSTAATTTVMQDTYFKLTRRA